MHEKWDRGVELSYLLNDARELSPADIKAAAKLADELGKLNWHYAFVIRGNRRTAANFKEPYYTINNLGDEVVLATQYSTEEQNIRKEKLIEALDCAVNSLIGRDVYVQEMNPSEIREAD